jgi:pyroglutamyl-peptidase
MSSKVLLTSFQTWLPYQKSNSSDDLLGVIELEQFSTASLFFLRQLPVAVKQASSK